MLYQETITPQCMACLKRLMEIPELGHFYLAEGTALSLRYGHRLSEDIDLFTEIEFDNNELEKLIRFYFADIESVNFSHTTFGFYCFLDDVKVDLMKWTDLWIEKAEITDTIRIATDKDIFPMKLQAAMTRGAKKDFLDIALLIEKHGLSNGIEWYYKKFPYNDAMIPLKSLTDFEMAEKQTTPVLLNSKPWPECKQTIITAVKELISQEE